jgi:hypothetical protein
MNPTAYLVPLVAPFLLAVPAHATPLQLSGAAPLPGDLAPGPLYGAQHEMRIAAGGGGYLAVWADERTGLASTVAPDPWEVGPSDIYGILLDAAGAPASDPILIDASPFAQVDPNVAWTGTHWLVSYESRAMSSTTYFTSSEVRAVRVSAAGVVLDPEPLVIENTDDDSWANTAAGDSSGNGWVFWTDTRTIWARRVDAAGTVGPTKVAYTNTSWLFDMDAVFAGDRFLLTWEGTGIRGRLLDASMNPLGAAFAISNQGLDPDVATDGTDFLVGHADLGTWPVLYVTRVLHDGTVPGPDVVIDAAAYLALEPPQVAWDGTSYVALWSEWKYAWPGGPQEELLYNRISAAGGLMLAAPQVLVHGSGGDNRWPAAASLGAGKTLLGWMDGRNSSLGAYDGYGTVLDASGTKTGDAPIMVGTPQQLWPAAAPGPAGATLAEDVNVIVFVSANSTETRVVAQRVDGNGNVLDPTPITLAGGTDTYRNTAVAWNGAEWLVVWEDSKGGALFNGAVLGMRLLPDGTPLDPAPFAILDGNFPAVGASGSAFLVAGSKLTSGDIRTMYGRRVAASGALLDAAPLFLGFDYALSPTVGGFDDRWLVAWHRKPTHDTPGSEIRTRFVLADGTTLAELSPTSASANELNPDLSITGDVATLAWSDAELPRYLRIAKDGTLLDPPAGLAFAGGQKVREPSVAFDGSKHVVTWVDNRNKGPFEPFVGDLFATRVDGAPAAVDSGGVALAADPKAPEGEAALVGRRGVMLVAYPAMIADEGGWRVVLGTWRDWEPLGFALAGSVGTPVLEPSGMLVAGATVRLDLAGGPPATAGVHFVGSAPVYVPLLGGTLVPTPAIALPIALDAAGASSIAGLVGAPLPPGAQLFVQTWLFDPAAPTSVAASQGFVATAP